MNAYAYCVGNPVNRADPTGHAPITKAMDSFLKSLVTGVPKKPRTISKPLATGGDTVAKTPSPSNKPHQKRLNINRRTQERRAHLKKLSNTIKQNEATLPIQDKYSTNNKITDIVSSTKLYEAAKQGYGFDKYPNPSKKFTFTDHEGNLLLDVTHFNITKDHLRILAARGGPSRDYTAVQRLEIMRADYIEKFTGIDLKSIRR